MFLIVGLGNPGNEYAHTRHNAGFLVVDELSRRFGGGEVSQEKWQAFTTQCSKWGQRICFVKPSTYMNLSGQAVARYKDFYKLPFSQILVIHDDIDLSPGRIKLVVGGGAAGHNGIRSLVQCLGGAEFLRLKIGVGRPQAGAGVNAVPVDKYVLAPFSREEQQQLLEKVDRIENGIELLISDGVSRAMNLLNVKGKQE